MSESLLDLVRELNSLNDDNLAERVIKDSDVQWCLSELQDILEAETPALTPPNEWVSVEERLPEKRDDYIVLTEDAEVFLCDYIPSVRQWWAGDSIIIDGRITHWMPLPKRRTSR